MCGPPHETAGTPTGPFRAQLSLSDHRTHLCKGRAAIGKGEFGGWRGGQPASGNVLAGPVVGPDDRPGFTPPGSTQRRYERPLAVRRLAGPVTFLLAADAVAVAVQVAGVPGLAGVHRCGPGRACRRSVLVVHVAAARGAAGRAARRARAGRRLAPLLLLALLQLTLLTLPALLLLPDPLLLGLPLLGDRLLHRGEAGVVLVHVRAQRRAGVGQEGPGGVVTVEDLGEGHPDGGCGGRLGGPAVQLVQRPGTHGRLQVGDLLAVGDDLCRQRALDGGGVQAGAGLLGRLLRLEDLLVEAVVGLVHHRHAQAVPGDLGVDERVRGEDAGQDVALVVVPLLAVLQGDLGPRGQPLAEEGGGVVGEALPGGGRGDVEEAHALLLARELDVDGRAVDDGGDGGGAVVVGAAGDGDTADDEQPRRDDRDAELVVGQETAWVGHGGNLPGGSDAASRAGCGGSRSESD